jgi:hypothetical protein
MFAEEMQHQSGAHNRKRYVGLAIANVEMAPGDLQRVVPGYRVQVDANPVDASPRKEQVKLKLPNQPATLIKFQLDLETEPRIGLKLDILAYQFL